MEGGLKIVFIHKIVFTHDSGLTLVPIKRIASNSNKMSCTSCKSGEEGSAFPAGCKNNGVCGINGCDKLNVVDWLSGMELPSGVKSHLFAEVRFKNTRKEFFKNTESLDLSIGDVVAVEVASGHDIGVVSLTGELVRLQMEIKGVSPDSKEIKKIYRKAKTADIERWRSSQALEKETMLKARKITSDLKLQMKIGDVEYQGDKNKATFYYTADDRVDFRELIKILADTFKVRIEMKQIGARQEAGRIGGIGDCGRELCCSTWLTDFRSVSTSAARYQQLSLNPMKLAGQCGKLKCCLNYELESYLDAIKDFPNTDKWLKTKKGDALHQKTDIFKRMMWYAYKDDRENFIPLSVDRVKEVLALNEKGIFPVELKEFTEKVVEEKKHDYENVVGQDSLTRFDKSKKQRPQGNKKRNKRHRER